MQEAAAVPGVFQLFQVLQDAEAVRPFLPGCDASVRPVSQVIRDAADEDLHHLAAAEAVLVRPVRRAAIQTVRLRERPAAGQRSTPEVQTVRPDADRELLLIIGEGRRLGAELQETGRKRDVQDRTHAGAAEPKPGALQEAAHAPDAQALAQERLLPEQGTF